MDMDGKFTFVGTGGESEPCGPAPAFSSQQRGHHVGFHPPLRHVAVLPRSGAVHPLKNLRVD